jgi:hypothetical protein
LLFHAIRHLDAACGTFAFAPRCIYVTAGVPSIKRRASEMAEITESAVRSVLETVVDPLTGKNVIALGMVSGVATRNGHVAVTLEVDPARGPALEPLRQAC